MPTQNLYVENERLKTDSEGRLRVKLPDGGRLLLERNVPFLCLVRKPMGSALSADALIKGEAAHLTVADETKVADLRRLIKKLGDQVQERWGALLVVEIWLGAEDVTAPTFRIFLDRRAPAQAAVEAFEKRLLEIRIRGEAAQVEIEEGKGRIATAGLEPILAKPIRSQKVFHLGLEVGQSFVHKGKLAPRLLRILRRRLSTALRLLFFEFAGEHCGRTVRSAQAFGPRRIDQAVKTTDDILVGIAQRMSLVLLATPTNLHSLWRQWKQSETLGKFRYRPVTTNVYGLKRELHNAPIEKIDDPALYQIMRDKQMELDRKLNMVLGLATPGFLQGSLLVYGGVDPRTLAEAKKILKDIPPRLRGPVLGPAVSAAEMKKRALREIKYYRDRNPSFKASVELRSDVAAGMMCSKGDLIIRAQSDIAANRVNALLQHEIGTHLLTYYNGMSQPLQLLGRGLPGNVTLQEGLAVFSEYLAGGLHPGRLRVLAARVVAVQSMLNGATLGKTIALLRDKYELTNKVAFDVTCRVYRGGGLTKDALYLEGLLQVVRYVQEGRNLEFLFLGKFALKHLPIIEELVQRGLLSPLPCKPRGLGSKAVVSRLKRIADLSCLSELIETDK